MSIKEKQNELVAAFKSIETWEDRYRKIIQLGKELPDLPDEYRIDSNKVKGCQSTVWLHAFLDENQNVIYVADSDAMIVRGLIAILLKIYSGQPPVEIMATPPEFIEELGLNSNLSQNRANGLYAMIKQIKIYAMAFQAKLRMNVS